MSVICDQKYHLVVCKLARLSRVVGDVERRCVESPPHVGSALGEEKGKDLQEGPAQK